MSTSIIWIRVLDMHTKYDNKTYTKGWQVTACISKLIASLKKWIKKKENEIPKYLGGK